MKPRILITITARTTTLSLRSRIKQWFDDEINFETREGYTFVDNQITPAYDDGGFRPGFPLFDVKIIYAAETEALAKQAKEDIENYYSPAKVEITIPKKSNAHEEFKAVSESTLSRRHSRLSESTYAKTMKYMDEHDTGTISAFHGHGSEHTEKGSRDIEDEDLYRADEILKDGQSINSNYKIRNKNREASKRLGEDLKKLGYTYFMVGGSFIEEFSADGGVTEKLKRNEWTYFVVDQNDTGNLKDDLINLGRKYHQEYILFVKKGSKDGIGYRVGFYKDDKGSTNSKKKYTYTRFPKDPIKSTKNIGSYGTVHHNEPNDYGDTQVRGKKYSFKY